MLKRFLVAALSLLACVPMAQGKAVLAHFMVGSCSIPTFRTL
jgi:hypothetical protein